MVEYLLEMFPLFRRWILVGVDLDLEVVISELAWIAHRLCEVRKLARANPFHDLIMGESNDGQVHMGVDTLQLILVLNHIDFDVVALW